MAFDFSNQAIFNQLNTAYLYLFQSKASELLFNKSNETRLLNAYKHSRYDEDVEEGDYDSTTTEGKHQHKKAKLFHPYESNSSESNSTKDDSFIEYLKPKSSLNEKLTMNIFDFIRPNLNQNQSKQRSYRECLDSSNFAPFQTETKQTIRGEFENTCCPICRVSLNSSNLKSHLDNELNELYELKKKSIYGKIEQRYEHKDDRKQVNKDILKKIQESRLERNKNKKMRRSNQEKLKYKKENFN